MNKMNFAFPSHTLFKGGLLCIFPLFALTLLAMRFFSFGYWHQAELPMLFLLGNGAFSFIWLLLGYRSYPKSILSTFKYPLVWTSYLIAFISLLIAPFQPVPLVTFWGTPQMGEGILFYLSLASITSLLILYSKIVKIRKYMIYWAFLIGSIIAVFTIIGSNESPLESYKGWEWCPYYFPDYLGFIAISFFIYILHLKYIEKIKLPYLFFPFLLFVFTFYFCYNRSLWYGTLLAIGGIIGLKLLTRTSSHFRKSFPYFSLLALIGFVGVLGFACVLGWKIPITMVTRGYFILYSFYNFATGATLQDFFILIFGRGWGEYQEFIAPNLFMLNTAELYSGTKMVVTQRAETISRDFFHSHNSLIEIFSALGIVGLGLFCVKIYYIAKSLKPAYTYWGALFLVTYWLLSSFWFELPVTVPFSLFAIVLISQKSYPKYLIPYGKKYLKPLFAISAFLLLLPIIPVGIMTTTIFNSSIIKKGDHYMEKVTEMTTNPWISLDHYLGFKRTAHMMRQISFQVLNMIEKGFFPIDEVYQGNRLMADYLFDRRLNCGNLYAMMIPINIYGELAVNQYTKELFDADASAQKKWEAISLAFNKCVPKRPDMLLPLLNNMTLKGKTNRVKKIVETLLTNNPYDPVGLWFSGTLKLENPATVHEGIEELKIAYRKGINRFIPISETLQRQLKGE